MISKFALLAQVILLLYLTDSGRSQYSGVLLDRILPGEIKVTGNTVLQYKAGAQQLKPALNNQSATQLDVSGENAGRVFRVYTRASNGSYLKTPSGEIRWIRDPDVSQNIDCNHSVIMPVTDSAEYSLIKMEMQSHYLVHNISKILKIVNRCLWRRYTYYRDIIQRQEDANETLLFVAKGNYQDFTGVSNRGYDERESTYSPGEPNGLFFIDRVLGPSLQGRWMTYVNRVALGNVYFPADTLGIAFPPPGYHSIGVNTKNTVQNRYVISRGEQVYPEYIVYFEIAGTPPYRPWKK